MRNNNFLTDAKMITLVLEVFLPCGLFNNVYDKFQNDMPAIRRTYQEQKILLVKEYGKLLKPLKQTAKMAGYAGAAVIKGGTEDTNEDDGSITTITTQITAAFLAVKAARAHLGYENKALRAQLTVLQLKLGDIAWTTQSSPPYKLPVYPTTHSTIHTTNSVYATTPHQGTAHRILPVILCKR